MTTIQIKHGTKHHDNIIKALVARKDMSHKEISNQYEKGKQYNKTNQHFRKERKTNA